MGDVAADADALVKRLQCRPIGARLHIVKKDVLVGKVADGLHSRTAGRHIVEQGASEIFQVAVHLTVAAGQQELQDIAW